ncbi:MAG: response regulator [Acidimicrobiales bacterium]
MRIVIADDHQIVREGIVWMLETEADIEIVAEAENGRALLEILETTTVDVILLDVRMPEMGGLEALELLQTAAPDVGVLVLSMHDEPDLVRRAVAHGAAGYMLKNSSREGLVKALRLVASGEGYVQGDVVRPLLDQLSGKEHAEPDPLTARERQILALVSVGCENKQIARRLHISEATVKTHLKAVFERLHVRSRAEAVAVGLRHGIIE